MGVSSSSSSSSSSGGAGCSGPLSSQFQSSGFKNWCSDISTDNDGLGNDCLGCVFTTIALAAAILVVAIGLIEIAPALAAALEELADLAAGTTGGGIEALSTASWETIDQGFLDGYLSATSFTGASSVAAISTPINSNNISLYSITSNGLENLKLKINGGIKKSILSFNIDTSKNAIDIIHDMVLYFGLYNKNNIIISIDNAVDAISNLKNDLKLFSATKVKNYNNINIFTSLLATYYLKCLKTNKKFNIQNAYDTVGQITNVNVNDYNFLQSNFLLDFYSTGNEKALKCVRSNYKILFIWNIVKYYANKQNIDIDIYFCLHFYDYILDNNFNDSKQDFISAINNSFKPLLDKDLIFVSTNLKSTINFWLNEIDKSSNLSNIYILSNLLPLLNNNMRLLGKQNLSIICQNNINHDIINKSLSEIISKWSSNNKTYADIQHYFSEAPLGISKSSNKIIRPRQYIPMPGSSTPDSSKPDSSTPDSSKPEALNPETDIPLETKNVLNDDKIYHSVKIEHQLASFQPQQPKAKINNQAIQQFINKNKLRKSQNKKMNIY